MKEEIKPFRRKSPKLQRNTPCPCGSGKKYKACCSIRVRLREQNEVISGRKKF